MQKGNLWNNRNQTMQTNPFKARQTESYASSFSDLQMLKRNMVKVQNSVTEKFSDIIELQSDIKFGFHIK